MVAKIYELSRFVILLWHLVIKLQNVRDMLFTEIQNFCIHNPNTMVFSISEMALLNLYIKKLCGIIYFVYYAFLAWICTFYLFIMNIYLLFEFCLLFCILELDNQEMLDNQMQLCIVYLFCECVEIV